MKISDCDRGRQAVSAERRRKTRSAVNAGRSVPAKMLSAESSGRVNVCAGFLLRRPLCGVGQIPQCPARQWAAKPIALV
jgi:hypothetical protein